MKVLLLVTEHEDYAISFASGLSRHTSVVLAAPRRQYERLATWFDPSVHLRLLDWPRHRSLSNPRFLLSLTRLVRRERPDVIHLLSHTALWLNLGLPFWRPIPVVTTVHDVDVHPGDAETSVLPEWAPNLIVRQSGDIIVHGEGLRLRAIERYAKPPDRVHVLSHPPNLRYPALAQREGLRRPANDTFTVLMFGRLMAYKGLHHLIQAEAALGDRVPNLRVVIAGRGNDPRELRHLMGDPERYDIRNRFIEDREVAQLFLEADVVALPYVEASQSGVLNIAAAFGRPVVATDVGEFRATVEAHRIGLVVPPGHPARLADAIARLAAQPALAAELGANARAWAEGTNAPPAIGAAAASLYRAIAARRVAPAPQGN
jgi:glycosyltransferase involved in cell wall biosynthesis